MTERRRMTTLIRKHFDRLRKSQRKTIRDLVLGLLRSRQVGQAAIARGMRDLTTVRHRIKRIWRFCKNDNIQCAKVFAALAQWICAQCSATLVVALDWTDLGDYKMLAAKVAVCSRAVPIAWTVVRKGEFSAERKSQNTVEERLIRELKGILDGRAWSTGGGPGFPAGGTASEAESVGYTLHYPCCDQHLGQDEPRERASGRGAALSTAGAPLQEGALPEGASGGDRVGGDAPRAGRRAVVSCDQCGAEAHGGRTHLSSADVDRGGLSGL